MKRSFIFRVIFITLWVLCFAAWVVSFWQGASFEYKGGVWDSVYVSSGRLAIMLMHSGVAPIPGKPLTHFQLYPSTPKDWDRWDVAAQFHGLGFSYRHMDSLWMITIPLWFPTFLSFLFLVLVWRKTGKVPTQRPNPQTPGNPNHPATPNS